MAKAVKDKEQAAVKAAMQRDEQEIIEVSQEEAKKALKILLSTKNDVLATLYAKFDEYNEIYFKGQLNTPLITIVKMNNRTLGRYFHGQDAMGLTDHIELNENFVAMNTKDRVLQTLRHEMIHQWQDDVLYVKEGATATTFQKATLKDGEIVFVEAEQKKRLADWHNNDFREMAAVVDIPAIGAHCTGNPAFMPKPQSYNRKFVCACEVSNGHMLTIWSTRDVTATCDECGQQFTEVRKLNPEAVTIMPKISHIEREGENAVENDMAGRFEKFTSFKTKAERKTFLTTELPQFSVYETGAYQKKHNAYLEGFRYWVAYTPSEVIEEPETPAEKPKAAKPKKAKKTEPVTLPPVLPELEPIPDMVEEPLVEPEQASEEVERVYDINNPQDLIDAYALAPTSRKAAELFGVNQSTFVRRAAKYKINFATGTYEV